MLMDRNLALEGKAASQHAGPSLVPGPPESQTAPSGEAETSGTAQSGGETQTSSSIYPVSGNYSFICIILNLAVNMYKIINVYICISKPNLTNICNVFLR